MAFLPEIFVESLEEILSPKRSFCARKNPSKAEDSDFHCRFDGQLALETCGVKTDVMIGGFRLIRGELNRL